MPTPTLEQLHTKIKCLKNRHVTLADPYALALIALLKCKTVKEYEKTSSEFDKALEALGLSCYSTLNQDVKEVYNDIKNYKRKEFASCTPTDKYASGRTAKEEWALNRGLRIQDWLASRTASQVAEMNPGLYRELIIDETAHVSMLTAAAAFFRPSPQAKSATASASTTSIKMDNKQND